MQNDNLNAALFDELWNPSVAGDETLLTDIESHPLTPLLFSVRHRPAILTERLVWWRRFVVDVASKDLAVITRAIGPTILWSYPLALAQHLWDTDATIVGICGPPGSGKSTLSAALRALFQCRAQDSQFINISLDDFYHPKPVREKRGLRWRAAPGSHDLDEGVRCLTAIRNHSERHLIPTFDQKRDDRGPMRTIEGPVAKAFVDGWFLGMREQGYERIAALVDYLIYLDCPMTLARRRRFAREEKIRADATAAAAGLSADEMEGFWSEILEPGVGKWVEPVKQAADLIIQLDDDGTVVGGQRNRR